VVELDVDKFSEETVESLATLQNLATLQISFNVPCSVHCEGLIASIENAYLVVHAAGRIENLKKLGISFRDDHFLLEGYFVEFIDRYTRFYPGKKLILDNIW
jgi:hypothetical protein